MLIAPALVEHIQNVARTNGARSFYLYDTRAMRAKIGALQKTLPREVEIFYAMKANPHPCFLAAAKDSGVEGIEIASLGEAEKAVGAGFKPEQILFTGPGKSPEELAWSARNKIRAVHLESLTEAHRLSRICGEAGVTQDILVRVNPNFDIHGAQAKFSGDSSKLGIDEDVFRQVLPQIVALPHLRFKGLHVYAASGVLKVEDLLENCRRVFQLAKEIEAKYSGLVCEVIDFGGGFGIDYLETGCEFSIALYAEQLRVLIERYGFGGRKFVIELGRYLAADSGWYCTEILDIKTSLGKKQVICQGGAHHFRRPVALNINHPLTIVPMQRAEVFAGQESVNREMVFIGGPLCNTADKLAPKDIYIEKAAIGDIAVFGLAGAYGYTMSHLDFLSHAHPPEIEIG